MVELMDGRMEELERGIIWYGMVWYRFFFLSSFSLCFRSPGELLRSTWGLFTLLTRVYVMSLFVLGGVRGGIWWVGGWDGWSARGMGWDGVGENALEYRNHYYTLFFFLFFFCFPVAGGRAGGLRLGEVR